MGMQPSQFIDGEWVNKSESLLFEFIGLKMAKQI